MIYKIDLEEIAGHHDPVAIIKAKTLEDAIKFLQNDKYINNRPMKIQDTKILTQYAHDPNYWFELEYETLDDEFEGCILVHNGYC